MSFRGHVNHDDEGDQLVDEILGPDPTRPRHSRRQSQAPRRSAPRHHERRVDEEEEEDDDQMVINQALTRKVNIQAAKDRAARSGPKLEQQRINKSIKDANSILQYWLCCKRVFCVKFDSTVLHADDGTRINVPEYFVHVKLSTETKPIAPSSINDTVRLLFRGQGNLDRYVGMQLHLMRGMPPRNITIGHIIRRVIYSFFADSICKLKVQVKTTDKPPNEQGERRAESLDNDDINSTIDLSDLVSYYTDIKTFRPKVSDIIAKRIATSYNFDDITPLNEEARPLIMTHPETILKKMDSLYKPDKVTDFNVKLNVIGVHDLRPLQIGDDQLMNQDMSFVVHGIADVAANEAEAEAISGLIHQIHMDEMAKESLSKKDPTQSLSSAIDFVHQQSARMAELGLDDDGENGVADEMALTEQYWDTHYALPEVVQEQKEFEAKIAKDIDFASKLPSGKTTIKYEENGEERSAEVKVLPPCILPPEMSDVNCDLKEVLQHDGVKEALKRASKNFPLPMVAKALMEPILAQIPVNFAINEEHLDEQLHDLVVQTMRRFNVATFSLALFTRLSFLNASKGAEPKIKVSTGESKKKKSGGQSYIAMR